MDRSNEPQAKKSGALLAGYLVGALAIGLVYGLVLGTGGASLFGSMAIAAIPPLALAYFANNKAGRGALSTGVYVLLATIYLLASALGFGIVHGETAPAVYAVRSIFQFVLMYGLIFFAVWLTGRKSTMKRSAMLFAALTMLSLVVVATAIARMAANEMAAKFALTIVVDEFKKQKFPIPMRDGTALTNVNRGDGRVVVFEYVAPSYMSFSGASRADFERKVIANYCENMKPLVSNGISLRSIYDHDGEKIVLDATPYDCGEGK